MVIWRQSEGSSGSGGIITNFVVVGEKIVLLKIEELGDHNLVGALGAMMPIEGMLTLLCKLQFIEEKCINC